MKNRYFIQAIQHAFNGIVYFFSTERNARIQLIATITVLVFAVVLGVTTVEWIMLLFCIAMVLCCEMFNTALECLCDLVHQENHPVIKHVKDIAAGAVLWGAIISCIIAAFIFLPKLFNLVI